MRINLHNHTTHSDGRLAPRELVQAAVDAGLTHIGVSDHFLTAKLPSDRTVTPEGVESYVRELREIGQEFAPQIRVLAALEIDFSFHRTDLEFVCHAAANDPQFSSLDYLLFEYVGEPGEGTIEELLDIRPGLPFPVGLAHPHLAATFGRYRPEVLAHMLATGDVFFELCTDPRLCSYRPARPDLDVNAALQDLRWFEDDARQLEAELESNPEDPNVRAHLEEVRRALDIRRADVIVDWPFNNGSIFCNEFWNAAREERLLLSIGADAHESPDEVGAIGPALDFLRTRDLVDQVVTRHRWLEAEEPESTSGGD